MLCNRKSHTQSTAIRCKLFIISLFFSFFSVFSYADNTPINSRILFEKPWIRLLPPTVMHTAAYVTIVNNTDTQDKLLKVSSPSINSVSVHQTIEVDGLFRMLPAENIVIPANGKLTMKPGSYHLMIMGLNTQLTNESKVTMSFHFEKAGVINVEFPASKTEIK